MTIIGTKKNPKTSESTSNQEKDNQPSIDSVHIIKPPFYIRHPKVQKVWFWLTAWRPITKWEYAKLMQQIIVMGQNLVSSDVEIKKKMNEIILAMSGKVPMNTVTGEQSVNKEKDDRGMFN